ncbi:MAG: alpha/beta hydrolase, partial [Promethearchaeota archaeon]
MNRKHLKNILIALILIIFFNPRFVFPKSEISGDNGNFLQNDMNLIPLIKSSAENNSKFILYSNNVEDNYTIYVSLPDGYDPNQTIGYHVIYLLDGDWLFGGSYPTLIGEGGIAKLVYDLGNSGAIPQSILVAIGEISIEDGVNNRNRDFLYEPFNFFNFIKDELIPYIDNNYNTNPESGRTLMGHSHGGFFTMYALCQYNNTPFTNFISSSGDFTKEDGLIYTEESLMHERIEADLNLNVSLYMGVGGVEEYRFEESNREMTEILNNRSYVNFKFHSEVYLELIHEDVAYPNMNDGLQWVFSSKKINGFLGLEFLSILSILGCLIYFSQ